MPLSEQEQRLLEEMERSLYHNDADFVASVSTPRVKPSYSVVVTGILIGIAGVAVLLAGVIIRQPIVGVLGFIAMFAGVLVAVTPRRVGAGGQIPRGEKAPSDAPPRGSFLQNLNERWEKRQQDQDE